MLIAFHKPYGVLSRFTGDGSAYRVLAEFGFPDNVYAIGRLDADSEGLLLLSDERGLNTRLLLPENGHTRTYWAQVEGLPDDAALQALRDGIFLQSRRTLPCEAWVPDPQPSLPERQPPIRFRASIPTRWLALRLREGKNRQVRRMTAAVGYPTLRLFRVAIGEYMLGELPEGAWRILDKKDRQILLSGPRGGAR